MHKDTTIKQASRQLVHALSMYGDAHISDQIDLKEFTKCVISSFEEYAHLNKDKSVHDTSSRSH